MVTISVANRKGGVGKSTTAHAMGAYLTRKGKRVLFIDLDSQTNLTYMLGVGINEDATALDFLTGDDPADIIRPTYCGDLIPASEQLSGADKLIKRETALKDALKPLSKKYDVVIVDNPSQLSMLTTNALTASNSVVIPVQADILSIQGLSTIYNAITTVTAYSNKKLKTDGILLTRYQGRPVLSRDMKEATEEMAEKMKTKVFHATIRECVALKEATATKQDIFSYEPKSNGAMDYTAFMEEWTKDKNF